MLQLDLIDVWYDRDISAGTEWKQEIKEHLDAAHIILLLVSPDFIGSDYCYGSELKRALERHERGEALVVPIILRHVYWQRILGKLQALPKDGIPVTDPEWHNLDKAFFDVVNGIEKVIERFQAYGFPENVSPTFRNCYFQLDDANIRLGIPKVTDSNDLQLITSQRGTSGYKWPFKKGGIYWSERSGAQPIYGAISYLYHNDKVISGRLGFPLTCELLTSQSDQGTTGAFQRFEELLDCPEDVYPVPVRYGASIYWTEKYGAHPTWGEIGICYERLGGMTSFLGFPTKPEMKASSSPQGTTGYYQWFEGGMIVSSEKCTVPVVGQIMKLYNKFSGSGGRFGFPLAQESSYSNNSNLRFQEFEGGVICIEQGDI